MLPAPFAYRETAAPAFLYRHAPFLLLGFMFQLIARHLLHTLNVIVVESFTTPHHYCPMSVQPLPAFTVTRSRCRWHEISVSANSMGGCNFCTLPYYSSRYLFLTFSGIILKTHPFIINKSAFRYKRTRKN